VIMASEKQVTSGKSPPSELPGKHADPGHEGGGAIQLPDGLAARLTRVLGLSKVWAWFIQPRVIGVVIVGDATKLPESEETRRGSDYRIVEVDLATARDRDAVLKDVTVASLFVDDLTPGASAFIHIGQRDPITAKDGRAFEMDPPEEIAISVTNTAQPGNVLKIGVGFGVRRTA